MALVFNGEGLGAVGSGAGVSLLEAVESAIYNSITMYSSRASNNNLVDIKDLEFFDSEMKENLITFETFNLPGLIMHYDPSYIEIKNIFWNKANIFVYSSWSPVSVDFTYSNYPYMEAILDLTQEERVRLDKYKSLLSGR